MRLIRIATCPRCNGDVFLERDIHGWYGTCLQCGHYSESMVEAQQQMGEQGARPNSQSLKPTGNGKAILYVKRNKAGLQAKHLLEGSGIELEVIEDPYTSTPLLKTPIGWRVGLDSIRDFVEKWKVINGEAPQSPTTSPPDRPG